MCVWLLFIVTKSALSCCLSAIFFCRTPARILFCLWALSVCESQIKKSRKVKPGRRMETQCGHGKQCTHWHGIISISSAPQRSIFIQMSSVFCFSCLVSAVLSGLHFPPFSLRNSSFLSGNASLVLVWDLSSKLTKGLFFLSSLAKSCAVLVRRKKIYSLI